MRHQHNDDLGGSQKGSNDRNLNDLKVPPPHEFMEFLGYDRCPLTLPKLTPGENTNILYLPWIHQPDKVPLVLKEIQEALALRPNTKAVIVLSEMVGPTKEEKEELEQIVNRAVNSEVGTGTKLYREIHERRYDGAKINPLLFEKMKAFRQIAWDGVSGQETFRRNSWQSFFDSLIGGGKDLSKKPSTPVYVKFLDITDKRDTQEILQVLKEEIQGQQIRVALNKVTLSSLRQQFDLPPDASDARRLRAAQEMIGLVLDLTSQEQSFLTRLISPLRNRTMAGQISEARQKGGDDLLVVLIGAGHSGVPYLESRKDDVAVRYIGLPDNLLAVLPESFKHQSFSSLRMNAAMLRVQGAPVPPDLMKRALIEPFVSQRIDSALNSFPRIKSKELHQELQSTEAIEFIVRTTLLMLPGEEMDKLLNALCIAPFNEVFDPQPSLTLGQLNGALVDDWLMRLHPEFSKGRSSMDYAAFANFIYERYLEV